MSLPLFLVLLFSPPQAPPPPNPGEDRPLYGGVPAGPATGDVLDLTLRDAIERGLQRNLGLLLGEQRVRAAQGARWEALSELLPHLNFHLSETRRLSLKDVREVVVLLSGDLYMRAVAEESRIDAARAQLATARALHELAQDRKKAGLIPSLDVLRAEVERARREQENIVAEARLAKAKLSLARAIGLPLGQQFRLADRVPYSPAQILPLEEALKTA